MRAAVAVAASGGRDSTALLHCTARAAALQGLSVHALHVNHGLVAGADDWARRLRAQCRRWASAGLPIDFHATRLEGAPQRGESVEAWARRERYRALAAMAHATGCTLVLLAHHRRDQAETLLLQALRGGGPAGLASMPRQAVLDGITWTRPWLDQPRAAIEAYLQRHRLRYTDDASNEDRRYARNRLRAEVWPALVSAFPDAETQIHAAATRAAEAAACLDELAAHDLGSVIDAGMFRISRWSRLSAARRANALRAWLRAKTPAAPESLVCRLVQELSGSASARWPAPGGELRAHDDVLVFAGAGPATPEGQAETLDLSRPGRYPVAAWQGSLLVSAADSGGVAVDRLARAVLRARSGGEQFQLAPRAAVRSLKKQFQTRRVPAWSRHGPLVFDADVLLFVPGLGIDARCRAPAGTPQRLLQWQPEGDR